MYLWSNIVWLGSSTVCFERVLLVLEVELLLAMCTVSKQTFSNWFPLPSSHCPSLLSLSVSLSLSLCFLSLAGIKYLSGPQLFNYQKSISPFAFTHVELNDPNCVCYFILSASWRYFITLDTILSIFWNWNDADAVNLYTYVWRFNTQVNIGTGLNSSIATTSLF